MIIPKRKSKVTKLEKIGKSLNDPYFYFRDKKNEEVMKYLKQENGTYEKFRSYETKKIEDEFYEEMVKLRNEDDVSVPYKLQGYYYYKRTVKGLEYATYYRHKDCPPDSIWKNPSKKFEGEELLLDLNQIAKGHEHCRLGTFEISTNGRYFVFSIDYSGDSEYNIYVKDLLTGKIVDEIVEKKASSDIAWANDNKIFFYLTQDEQQRPFQLYRHELFGKEDALLFHEEDEAFYMHIGKSLTEKYIYVMSESDVTSEYLILEANEPFKKFFVLIPRSKNVEYTIFHHHVQGFIVIHNFKDYENFHLQKIPENVNFPKTFEKLIEDKEIRDFEVFPYDKERYIMSFLCKFLKNYFVLWCRVKGFVKVIVFECLEEHKVYDIKFDELNYDSWGSSNYVYDTDIVRFFYSSLVTPTSVYDYNCKTKELKLRKREIKEGVYERSKYLSECFFVKSRDGAEIPVSLVYNKYAYKKPSMCLLTAYGAYASSNDPTFRSNIICMLDRGMCYCIAHVRGGSEKGREWYKAGKLLNKKNTFFDFIDVAKYLISEKYTISKKLVAYGCSAGGLLSATFNMNAELFAGGVFDVPFVDLMNTMSDTTIPLTVREWEEWGNPNEKEYFEYMMSYSPVDNLKYMNDYYPSFLLLTNLNDTAVGYWEALKFIATAKYYVKKNKVKCDQMLLRCNMTTGHFGASGRYELIREYAMIYSWLYFTAMKSGKD